MAVKDTENSEVEARNLGIGLGFPGRARRFGKARLQSLRSLYFPIGKKGIMTLIYADVLETQGMSRHMHTLDITQLLCF